MVNTATCAIFRIAMPQPCRRFAMKSVSSDLWFPSADTISLRPSYKFQDPATSDAGALVHWIRRDGQCCPDLTLYRRVRGEVIVVLIHNDLRASLTVMLEGNNLV